MYFVNSLPILLLSAKVLASSGDRSDVFVACVFKCDLENCRMGQDSPSLPVALHLTGWSCRDDCKYTCMHGITDDDVANGGTVQQYYGKWPFWRFAGMQEPASVTFSLLNLWAHYRGYANIRTRVPNNHPMKFYYIVWSFVSINAWIWSSVFHTRDLPTTEKLDYFSAALAIMFALYYTVVRLFHLYRPLPHSHLSLATEPIWTRQLVHKAWTATCTFVYVAHVSYLMMLPRFDYTYNIAFNLGIGLTHNLLWLVYALPASVPILSRYPGRPKFYRPPFTYKAAMFVLLTTAATALELFDFPPWWRVIDAHALWHLSTAPIAFLWYGFLVEDSLDEGWKGHKS